MAERFLSWLAAAVCARPRRIASACILAALLGAAWVSRMPLRTDLLDALPAGNPEIVAFTDFFRDFGLLDGLVVVVESEEPSPDVLIEAVESLGERLAASPLLESIDYNVFRSNARFLSAHFPVYLDRIGVENLSGRLTPAGIRRQVRGNLEALRSPFSSPLEGELVRRDPLNIRGIVRDGVLRNISTPGMDLGTGYYLDSAHRLAMLMARPKGSYKDMAFVGRLDREVRRIADLALEELGRPAGVRVRIAGGYARAAEAAATIWRDMVVSFATSIVLVLLLVFLSFRPPAAVLGVIVATLCCALSWTLVLAYALFGGLNIVTSIVAAMLIGLYVDYALHVYKRFDEILREKGDIPASLRATFTGTGKALLTGAATSSLAFFSVVVTRFRGLYELGVVAGFGILFCLAATLLLMGSLLVLLASGRTSLLRAGRPGSIPTGWLAAFLERRRKWAGVGVAILILSGVAGLPFIRFESGVDSLGVRKSSVAEVEKRLAEVAGKRGEPLFLVARPPDRETGLTDFETMERLGRRWRDAGRVGRFLSPGAFLPPPSAQAEARALLSRHGLPGRYSGDDIERLVRTEMERQGMVADPDLGAYAAGIAKALSDDRSLEPGDLVRGGIPRAGYIANGENGAFAAHMASQGTGWDASTLARLQEDVLAAGPDFTLVGPALIFHRIRDGILRDSALAILISFLGNLLVVRYHFRSWRRVLLVMLPVAAGTVLTAGTMGLLGLPFNFFNVAAIALIFGFGVDYGVYMMQSEVEDGGGAGSLRSVGGTVALCSLTTVASCGSLMTSHYRGLSSIGEVLSIGAFWCLLTSLILFPLAFRRFGEKVAAR
jgi:predicted RND superfamily exporter protein